jgi:hypothetical protein
MINPTVSFYFSTPTLLAVFIGARAKFAMVNRPTGVIRILAGRKSPWQIS